MKPIPKELQAYFPKAADPTRPWWNIGAFSNGLPTLPEWRRSGDAAFWSNPAPTDRAEIDETDPLPPPPILVGQVWALRVPGSPLYVGTITHTKQSHDLMVGLSGVGTSVLAEHLINDGYLLSCPYGYAPWSGPEVT